MAPQRLEPLRKYLSETIHIIARAVSPRLFQRPCCHLLTESHAVQPSWTHTKPSQSVNIYDSETPLPSPSSLLFSHRTLGFFKVVRGPHFWEKQEFLRMLLLLGPRGQTIVLNFPEGKTCWSKTSERDFLLHWLHAFFSPRASINEIGNVTRERDKIIRCVVHGKFPVTKIISPVGPSELRQKCSLHKALAQLPFISDIVSNRKVWGKKSEDLGSGSSSTQFLATFYWISNTISGLLYKIEKICSTYLSGYLWGSRGIMSVKVLWKHFRG